jgi:TRAP-type uncharacterized transport system substrate-binding protein
MTRLTAAASSTVSRGGSFDARSQAATRVPVTGHAATELLQKGTVDAVLFVVSDQAPMLREVARVPDLKLMSFPRADAYARQFPFLIKVTLPEGGLMPPAITAVVATVPAAAPSGSRTPMPG